jgi:hypothetical protein
VTVESYISAAAAHGRESEPDHEVGDLQQLLRAAWGIMSPEQRAAWRDDAFVREVLEWGGDVEIEPQQVLA